MSKFCPLCNSVLSEKTSTGSLMFQCKCCGFIRDAQNEETLCFEKKYNSTYEMDFTSADDIVNDEISQRIRIDCVCGSKVGALRLIGSQCNVMKICLNCKTSLL